MITKRNGFVLAATLGALLLAGWGTSLACDKGKDVAKAEAKAAKAGCGKLDAKEANGQVAKAEGHCGDKAEAAKCAHVAEAAKEGKPCPFVAEGKPCPFAAAKPEAVAKAEEQPAADKDGSH